MTKRLTLLGLIIYCSIPLILWQQHTNNLLQYFQQQTPPGQVIYLFSKLLGLYAIFLLSAQAFFGLITLGRRKPLWPIHTIKRHILLGTITTTTIIAHALLFFWAASVRGNTLAWNTLIPSFSHGYYKTAISLGIIATMLLAVVIISGVGLSKPRHSKSRQDSTQRQLKLTNLIHRFSLFILLLGFLHSFLIGSEAGSTLGMMIYAMLITLLIMTLIIRIKVRKTRHS